MVGLVPRPERVNLLIDDCARGRNQIRSMIQAFESRPVVIRPAARGIWGPTPGRLGLGGSDTGVEPGSRTMGD